MQTGGRINQVYARFNFFTVCFSALFIDGKPLSTKTSDISTPASERKGGDDSSASQSARWQIYATESLADSHHKTGLHFQTLNSCSF